MFWYVITFIAGLFIGMIFGVFALAILSNNKIDETDKDDSVLNPDGTPKKITFKPTDYDDN